jgi:hypothetical protein
MYRHNIGVWIMSITCSSCIIRGQRICLHLTVGEKWVIDNLEKEGASDVGI